MTVIEFRHGAKFRGYEINQWCEKQIRQHDKQYNEARHIYSHYVFRDRSLYCLIVMKSCGNMRPLVEFMKVEE